MVDFLIGRLTDFVKELIMSMIEKCSLQQAERAMTLSSIVDKAISVCSFDCHNMTGYSAKVMINLARLLVQAGSVCSS
jgi:hypothetical protein